MQENALAISGLTKRYTDFVLDNVTFHVPKGTIVGLIGENGAGKSTAIHAILDLIKKDAGTVSILGKLEQEFDNSVREQIGVVFDGSNFPEVLTPRMLNKVLKNIYRSWDEPEFLNLMQRLSLPLNKKIQHFSKGMKMKLSIAVALSHHTRLLVLDEATSGLDPVMRDDILDMLLDFVQDEENAILVSSHITSDLEKIADYIVFIHNGRVVFHKSKDELLYQYGIIKCGEAQFNAVDPKDMVAYRKQDYGYQVLVVDKAAAQKKYPKALIDPATIDEIMLLYVKGESK